MRVREFLSWDWRSGRERKASKVARSIMGAEGWKAEGSGRGKSSWM